MVLSSTGVSVSELVKLTNINGKAYVASFAPYVFEAYTRGDKVAEEILIRRVNERENLLFGVYNAYGKEQCEITLFGGLNRQWDTLSNFLSSDAKEKITFKLPDFPVVYGALKRAKQQALI